MNRDFSMGWIVIGGIAALLVLLGVTSEIGPAAIPIWFATVGGATLVLRGRLGAAIAERLTGRRDDVPAAALNDEAYAELDELRRRVYELEERMDFGERLLAARPADAVRRDPPSA